MLRDPIGPAPAPLAPRSAGRGSRALLALASVCVGVSLGCGSTGVSSGPSASATADPAGNANASTTTPGGAEQPAAGASAADPGAATPASSARFDTADAPVRGPAEGQVLVEVFSDFECPYCSHARRHTERLLNDFPSVRVAYRHFPLASHPHAQLAAEASVEAYAQAASEGFWCYHDQVFDHQHELSRDVLVRLARRCDLDPAAMDAALEDHRHEARVTADRLRGDALGLRGTPSFTVNGTLVDGADYTDVEEAVDRVHPAW